jgi:hypothetical protein
VFQHLLNPFEKLLYGLRSCPTTIKSAAVAAVRALKAASKPIRLRA